MNMPPSTSTSFGWMLVWMLLVLILVVGGMLLLSHFIKRFPNLGQRRGERLMLEESLALTGKASVHIVHADGERMLIGTNDGAISHLALLDPQDDEDA